MRSPVSFVMPQYARLSPPCFMQASDAWDSIKRGNATDVAHDVASGCFMWWSASHKVQDCIRSS